jgi:hypothetical protein
LQADFDVNATYRIAVTSMPCVKAVQYRLQSFGIVYGTI